MDIDKVILKFIRSGRRTRIANTICKEKKIGRLTQSYLKTYFKIIVIKTVCYDERIDKPVNWIESTEIGQHKYRQLAYDEVTKVALSTNGSWTNGHPHAKTNKQTNKERKI